MEAIDSSYLGFQQLISFLVVVTLFHTEDQCITKDTAELALTNQVFMISLIFLLLFASCSSETGSSMKVSSPKEILPQSVL